MNLQFVEYAIIFSAQEVQTLVVVAVVVVVVVVVVGISLKYKLCKNKEALWVHIVSSCMFSIHVELT